ncbi:MAG: prepilin-type N-terminal cleavage/methylation domain-containing protein [Pseudomonadota bacterium]
MSGCLVKRLPRRAQRRRAGGSGLVEVLVALLIIGIASAGLLRLRVLAADRVADAGYHSTATLVAHAVLEEIRLQQPRTVAMLVPGTTWDPVPPCDKPCVMPQLALQAAAHWQQLATMGGASAMMCPLPDGDQLRVIVQWRQSEGSASSQCSLAGPGVVQMSGQGLHLL